QADSANGDRGRGGGKSSTAYRTISEVSDELDVPQHVLRFWETKFTQVRPLKRGGGRRYYRPEDVDLLRRIQALLYRDGYTIKGVQRLLKEGRAALKVDPEKTAAEPLAPSAPDRPEPQPSPEASAAKASDGVLPPTLEAELETLLAELKALRALLYRRGE
ncbi:MAG: MerR family transcriptional regulator, partial [Inquilinaceae bacterium]